MFFCLLKRLATHTLLWNQAQKLTIHKGAYVSAHAQEFWSTNKGPQLWNRMGIRKIPHEQALLCGRSRPLIQILVVLGCYATRALCIGEGSISRPFWIWDPPRPGGGVQNLKRSVDRPISYIKRPNTLNTQGRLDPRRGLCCFWCPNKTWTPPLGAFGTLKVV
jgi:hypothetical protein